jgi:lipopolysaccharide transport system permease protein
MRTPREIVIIEAKGSSVRLFREIWRFRELFFFLAWKDILLRYKQTAFGVGWALLRPILTMLLLTLVFSKVAGLRSDPVPYPLFVLAGMLVWQFFSGCASDTSLSLISNSSIVTKVYFPRMIVPSSATFVNAVDFFVGVALFFLLFFFWKQSLSLPILFLPLWILLLWILALGVGFWLSAATVVYRDVRFVVPFFLQLGNYASPVGYSTQSFPVRFKHWIYLNPLSGIIDGFRSSIFNQWPENPTFSCVSSVLMTALIFWSGFAFFRRLERGFSDVI